MARPPLKDEDKRLIQVNIRLTQSESERVCGLAEASALTPANWIRQKVFTGRFPEVKVSPMTAAVYRELHRIGVNLNQAVKQMNAGKQINITGILAELAREQRHILKLLIHDSRPGQGQGVPGSPEL